MVSRGPNNQLISVRETLYLAIKLNRSFIMPPMFKHGLGDPTANGEVDIIPAHLRLNVHRVRELIYVAPLEDVKSLCPDIGFDAFYQVVKGFCKQEGLNRLRNTVFHNPGFFRSGTPNSIIGALCPRTRKLCSLETPA